MLSTVVIGYASSGFLAMGGNPEFFRRFVGITSDDIRGLTERQQTHHYYLPLQYMAADVERLSKDGNFEKFLTTISF